MEHGLKLLELPDGAEGTALLDVVLAGGASFKGAGDETVVLCTPSSTYGVKRVDTSNIMLLLDGWEGQGPDPGAADAPATAAARGRGPGPEPGGPGDAAAAGRPPRGPGGQRHLRRHA